MLEEFDGDIFVGVVVLRQAQGHVQHVQRIHAHPGGGVGLLQVALGRRQGGTVQRGDVVQPHEPALEQVVVAEVLVVHPPGEVDQQLVEDPGQEMKVGAAVELEDLDRGPGVHRRVDVGEIPFIGRNLAVRMHVPLAQQQHELTLGECRVDVRQGHAVERQIPGREPRVLPRVRHEDDLVVVQMSPVAVADGTATGRRRRLARVPVEPALHVVVEELLAPQQAGERLPGHLGLVRGAVGRDHRGVEVVRLGLAGRRSRASNSDPRSISSPVSSAGSPSTSGCGLPTIRTLITRDSPAGTVTEYRSAALVPI